MEIIRSSANAKLTQIRKLYDKKHRDKMGLYVFEGYKLFCEAKSAGMPLEYVLLSQTGYERYGREIESSGYAFYVAEDELYRKICSEGAPQGIICVGKYIDKIKLSTTIYIDELGDDRIFILENVQDPGNLGTVIRSAAAFGYDRIILSRDCADVYSHKTVRASMGAVFKMKLNVVSDLPKSIELLRSCGYSVYSAELSDKAESILKVNMSAKTVFAVGNEGSGIRPETSCACDGSVIIDLHNMESLNASVAASILMWECSKSF